MRRGVVGWTLVAWVGGLGGCASAGGQGRLPGLEPVVETGWVQGIFGLAELDDVELEPAPGLQPAELDATVPYVGAAWQVPLRGDGVRIGYEAGGFIGLRYDKRREDLGGGAQVLVIDEELLLLEAFGGLSIVAHPGDLVRVYLGVGPTFQYGELETDLADPLNQPVRVDGSGFGLGWYARAGIEARAWDAVDVGLGVRWVDASIDLGRELGDLDYEAAQVLLTFTTGF